MKYATTEIRTINWKQEWQNGLENHRFISAMANKSDCTQCRAPYIIRASNVASKSLGYMEYITWNDCTIKINECSEIYMDFMKVFDIVSVQQER